MIGAEKKTVVLLAYDYSDFRGGYSSRNPDDKRIID